jgi:ParB-like chromosome segregation protein Spo0J
VVPISNLLPLKQLKSIKGSAKYQQVLSSIREVGMIEPLVVFPQKGKPDTFLVVDGHVRLEALKQLGHTETICLVSTDDESYTYNKRINGIAPIQEHAMILRAIKNGNSEERIAKVLNVNVATIRHKRELLDGICAEAADLLKTKRVASGVFAVMKKMKPMRQIEVAEILVAASNFSVPYTKALLAATPSEMLVEPDKNRTVEGLTPEQMAKMEKEMEVLQRDLKSIEESHGDKVLHLVLASGYLEKLFKNARVVRYLTQRYSDIFHELQGVLEGASLQGDPLNGNGH